MLIVFEPTLLAIEAVDQEATEGALVEEEGMVNVLFRLGWLFRKI